VAPTNGLWKPFSRLLKKWEDNVMEDFKDLNLDFTDFILDPHVNRRQFLKVTGGGIFIFMLIGHMPAWAQEQI